VRLAKAGTPPADVPIVAGTLDPSMVSLEVLDPAHKWNPVALGPVAYSPTPSQISIPASGLSAGSPPAPPPVYRLSIVAPVETPVVDQLGRPLALPYVRTLTFVMDSSSGNIQLNTVS
jgi:hypothetical protein